MDSRVSIDRNKRVSMPVIDLHTHLFPPSARAAALRGGPWHGSIVELSASGSPVLTTNGHRREISASAHMESGDIRVERMDELGIDVQVLSLLPPLLGYDLGSVDAVGRARAVNDDLAEWMEMWPGRFLALGCVPASVPDVAISEIESLATRPGFVGIEVGSHVGERAWDDPHLFPVLQAAEQLDLLVFLHPNDVAGQGVLGRYYLHNGIGNPLETTSAAAALIFGGVLDRLPKLRVGLAHGGGYLPFGAGRLDHLRRVRAEAVDTSQRPPSDYLKRFLVDALVHDDRAVRFLVDVFGADRVVLGSDHPANMGPIDPAGAIKRNSYLADHEREAILGTNLVRELRLDPVTLRPTVGGPA